MTMKFKFCLTAVAKLNDDDLGTVTDKIEAYRAQGMDERQSELAAVDDAIAQLEAEQAEVTALLRTQHPALFAVKQAEKAPDVSNPTPELNTSAEPVQKAAESEQVGDEPAAKAREGAEAKTLGQMLQEAGTQGIWLGRLNQSEGPSVEVKVIKWPSPNYGEFGFQWFHEGKPEKGIPFPTIKRSDTAGDLADLLLGYLNEDGQSNKFSIDQIGEKHGRLVDQRSTVEQRKADAEMVSMRKWRGDTEERPWDAVDMESKRQYDQIAGKRYKTAADETMMGILTRRAEARPDKWKSGDGVGYKPTRDQINRGFQIVRVNQADKTVTIRQVADTGLTRSGGNDDRMGAQTIDVGDLVRDRKYDAPSPPDAAQSAAPAPAAEAGKAAQPVAQEESAVYAVNEPGATRDAPIDLFPESLEGLQTVPGTARGPDARPKRKAAQGGDVQPAGIVPNTLALRQDPAFPGVYYASTQLVEVGRRDLPVSRVKTWDDAANALAAMRRFAVEHMDILITDKDGKPLAVVGSFKGARSQASVYPATILAEALRIDGAAMAWGVHNHPSGSPELSRADEHLSAAIGRTFGPSTVKWMGLAAVGRTRWNAVDADGDFDSGAITPADTKTTVAIVERTIDTSGVTMPAISSPSDAKRLVKQISGGKPGVVFLSSQHELTGWMPAEPAEMAALRKDGRFDKLVNASAEAGAGAAIISNPGGAFPSRTLDNIASALGLAEIRILDSIDPVTGKSAAEAGDLPNSGVPVLDRAGTPGNIKTDLIAEIAKQLNASGIQINVARTLDDMPPARKSSLLARDPSGRARGAYFPGADEVWVIASNLSTIEEMVPLVLHESFHRGLHITFGKDGAQLLRQLYAANKRVRDLTHIQMSRYGIGKLEAINEALAELAGSGEATNLNGWQKLVRMIREWLTAIAKATGRDIQWTDAQINDLVANLTRAGLRGEPAVNSYAGPDTVLQRAEAEDDATLSRAQTETPAFKKWFAGSTITNEDGTPKVMYHGTGQDITSFLPKQAGAIFLTPEPVFAESYAVTSTKWMRSRGMAGAPNVMPVFVRAERPFDYADEGHRAAVIQAALSGPYGDGAAVKNHDGTPTMWTAEAIDEALKNPDLGGNWMLIEEPWFQDAIKSLGHDSFYVDEGGFKNLGVYDPAAVKSAIGNSGAFDPEDQSILLARGKIASMPDNTAPGRKGDAQGATQGKSVTIQAGKDFVQKIEALAEKHGRVFIRWSPSSQLDLSGEQRSRDFAAGAVHDGLSAIEVTDKTHPVDIAKALSEYMFLRMQDHEAVPHVYLADRVGTDSDGYASIKPKTLLMTAGSDVISAVDVGLSRVMDLEDEIATAKEALAKFGDAPSAGKQIREQAMRRAHDELARLMNEQPAPINGGASNQTSQSILLAREKQDLIAAATDTGPVPITGEQGKVAASFKGRVTRMLGRLDHTINGLGDMPDSDQFLAQRYLTLGKIAAINEVAGGVRKAFGEATKEDKAKVYEYLTERDANPDIIQNERTREVAVGVKQYINNIGDNLVERGLLPEEAREEYRDRYLPRMYLAHMLDEGDWRAIGTGKKVSDMGYLKKRKDIPEEIRDVILGEVKDPAFLAATALAKPMRDMALLDWLEQISGNEQWVWPASLVEWKGKKVSAYWLKAEADALRTRARLYPLEVNRDKAMAIAEEMDALASEALRGVNLNHKDYKQIPNTARYGRLRGMLVRREIHDDLMGAQDFMPKDPGWVEQIVGYGGYGTKLTQVWKMSKVALNIPGQVRNAVSNAVMLQLSGVPLHKLPVLMARAIKQVRNGGKHWAVAKKYGVTESTFQASEMFRARRDLIDLEKEMGGMTPWLAIKSFAAAVGDMAGDAYQFTEAIFKTVKIMDGMERLGLSEEESSLEAQKWLFDYSLLDRNLRYARNAPIGAPFVTFTAKVLPRLAEVALLHPQRFLPWVALMYGMQMWAQAVFGGDDDEWKALKNALPKWMQDKGHIAFLPFRDAAGRLQAVDLAYFFPWSQWSELAMNTAQGKLGDAAKNLGIFGGPVTSIITALTTGVDPFTDKPIVQEGDPPAQQAKAMIAYTWDLMVPPMMASTGVVSPMWALGPEFGGKLAQATTGATNRYGDEKATYGQAVSRLFGANAYGIDPEVTRTQNLVQMKADTMKVQARLRARLMDRGVDQKRANELVAEYADEMKARAKKMDDYAKKSKVPKFAEKVTDQTIQ